MGTNETVESGHPMAYNMSNADLADDIKERNLTEFEEELYKVIDDIDTYDDMAKENFKMFRNLTMKRIKEFHSKKLVISDGYFLWKTNTPGKTEKLMHPENFR